MRAAAAVLLLGCGVEQMRIEPPTPRGMTSLVKIESIEPRKQDEVFLQGVDVPLPVRVATDAKLNLHWLYFEDRMRDLDLPDPLRLAGPTDPVYPLAAHDPRGFIGTYEDAGFSGWTEIAAEQIVADVQLFDPSPEVCSTPISWVINTLDVCIQVGCEVVGTAVFDDRVLLFTDELRSWTLTADGTVTPLSEDTVGQYRGFIGPAGRGWIRRWDGLVQLAPDGTILERRLTPPGVADVSDIYVAEDGRVYFTSEVQAEVYGDDGADGWTSLYDGTRTIGFGRIIPVPGGLIASGIDNGVVRLMDGAATLDLIAGESDDYVSMVGFEEGLGPIAVLWSGTRQRAQLNVLRDDEWTSLDDSMEPSEVLTLVSGPELIFGGGETGAGKLGTIENGRFCTDSGTLGEFIPQRMYRFGDGLAVIGRRVPLFLSAQPFELRYLVRAD